MILLTGKSLNERHRELNSKVNEAATQEVLFEEVKGQTEKSDVDRLYKIKLADKYRNVEYIIDTLKCGDNLYITKALKCAWICDEEFSNIINPVYLEENIFPEMSFKMKRKLLTMISMHVTNDRAASFYTYSMKTKLTNIAYKFLLNTTAEFKVDVIKGGNISSISDETMIVIIGKSFSVAMAVLETFPVHSGLKYLHNLRYLYSVSNVEYLDLVEKYTLKHKLSWNIPQRLGLRISKHIIKNHKERILRRTELYINMLNKSMLAKYTSPHDVKKYAQALVSSKYTIFWDFNHKYNFLFCIIPLKERLQFLKTLFTSRYPDDQFEMDIQFYKSGLHKLMTKEERESWALKHMESGLEPLGPGKDYIWYNFISFDKALVAIKKYILVTADNDLRNEIVRVLIYSAQSNRELETLFNYYYQRHVNEKTYYKEKFVNEVLNNHKYFNFDEECWNAFNKILHSMDVYDSKKRNGYKKYLIKSMVYSIIHGKELHSSIKHYIHDGIHMYQVQQEADALPEGTTEIVYQYLLNLFLETIRQFELNEDDGAQYQIRTYIRYVLDLMDYFHKPKKDIPDLVMKHVQVYFEAFKYHSMIHEKTETPRPLTEGILIKDLKNEASLVVLKIPSVRIALQNGSFRLNKLFRKIRVYFSADIALKYTELLKELLLSEDTTEATCKVAIYGIFQIAMIAERIDFLTKYIPTESKIAHDEIERNLLYIRTAICKYVCFARPVIPLLHIKNIVRGDYVKFCMPMMQSYAANLQPAVLADFVKMLLNSPASVQKHGLRLAFKCFNVKDLKGIISDVWKNTKNVSLRLTMYQTVYKQIKALSDEDLQTELFETLNSFTLDLREDDDQGIFDILCKTDLPRHILGEHILSGWKGLNTLPEKDKFTELKSNIVMNMRENINLMPQDLILSIISEHINVILNEKNIKNIFSSYFVESKWYLAASYITFFPDKDAVEQKLQIAHTIIKECIKLWDITHENVLVVRKFFAKFIDIVQDNLSLDRSNMYEIRLMEQILKDLLDALPLIEIYDTVWSLRVGIIVRYITAAVKAHDNTLKIFEESVNRFAVEFRNLLNEFIEQGYYYITAQEVISPILKTNVQSLMRALPNIEGKSSSDVIISVCAKLIEIEKFETYYFALHSLPFYYDEKSSLYSSIIRKMRSFDNSEFQLLLYRQLVCRFSYDIKKYNC